MENKTELIKPALKTHIGTLQKEMVLIQHGICDTDNIPSKELVARQKKYVELQAALSFVLYLNDEYNIKPTLPEQEPEPTSKLVSLT